MTGAWERVTCVVAQNKARATHALDLLRDVTSGWPDLRGSFLSTWVVCDKARATHALDLLRDVTSGWPDLRGSFLSTWVVCDVCRGASKYPRIWRGSEALSNVITVLLLTSSQQQPYQLLLYV